MKAILLTLGGAALLGTSQLKAQAVPAPAPASKYSSLRGMVIDSLHESPLANASILIEGTERVGFTDKDGRYQVDSIAPGKHKVLVMHALLDTLGITMRTPEYNFIAGETHELDVPIPGPEFIAKRVCSAAQQALGPAVMMGFVKDPDTHDPAVGVRVELVYQQADLIGRKTPRVRSAQTDSSGAYRICGLPKDMSGKVQVFRNGVSS